jgi:putative heme-binding domain-containing protein
MRGLTIKETNQIVREAVGTGDDPLLAARGLWQSRIATQPGESVSPEGMEDKFNEVLAKLEHDPRSRTQATRTVLKDAPTYAKVRGRDPQEVIEGLLESDLEFYTETLKPDERHPMIFREIALALPKLEANRAIPFFYSLAKLYDGSDHFYRAALNIACGTDPARRDAILADFDKHFPEWNDKVADLVWELRPKSVLPRLGKLLGDPKLTAAQKARIIDILAANDDLSAGRTMLDVLKSDAAPEMKSRAIESLRLFLPTKWSGLKNNTELTAAIDGLLSARGASGPQLGLQLIAAADAVNRIDDVAKIAADGKAPIELRKEAVRTLGQVPGAKSVDALIAIGAPKNALTIDCINALGELLPRNSKGPAYGQQALDALKSAITLDASTPEIRAAAMSALAANRVGTGWLLDAHQKGELPKEIVPDAGKLLRNSPFQGERNRALLLFPAPGKLNPKKLPPIAELVKRVGNAERGKQVWNASFAGAAQCAKCHMVRGVGGQVGPDLSMIGKKASKENLFESILIPSKAIADQFIVTTINTVAGQTIAGLLIEDSDKGVRLRDANGKDYAIDKADIDRRSQSKVSLMPEDIVAGLTEDELIDLVAYMQTLQTAALTPSSFKLAGPFKAGNMLEALGKDFGPERGSAADAFSKKLMPEPNGYFDLAKFHGTAAANSASYMIADIESPADQDAEILLGTDDGAKLWVNGREVFKIDATRAAAPGQNTVPVKLKKGKNEVLLKVANGNSPHGFYFTVLSKEETKVAGR